MAASRPNRKPTFFWQALLIILPVAIVSTVALVAIRRDRAVVEEEARRGAGQLANQLAADLATRLPVKLSSYDDFSEKWFKHQLTRSPTLRPPPTDEDYAVGLEEWRAANPHLDPETVLPNRFGCSPEGALVWPHDYDEPPQAPQWLIELTNPQRHTWDSLRAAELRNPSGSNLQATLQDFINTQPPPEARINAEFLSLRNGLPRQGNLAAFLDLQEFSQKCGGVRTESGLPLLTLVAVEALRVGRQGAGQQSLLTVDFDDHGGYFDKVLSWTLDEPSVLTPVLIEQLEALTISNSTQSAQFQPAIVAARERWAAQQRFHEMSEHFRSDGLLHGLTGTNFWLDYESTLWLCRATRGHLAQPQISAAKDGSWTTNQIVWVRAYPKEAVDRAAAESIRELGLSIPDYVGLGLRIEGQIVGRVGKQGLSFEALPIGGLSPDPPLHARRSGKYYLQGTTNDRNGPSTEARVMAETQGTFASLPVSWSSEETPASSHAALEIRDESTRPAKFRVQLLLVDPELLFARQRQRGWLLGALILASSFAACVGLAAAYRSFRRQLRLNELKSNFVSSVSHELRAPIASVRLMAESLERGKIADSTKQKEYFHFIVQECHRLSSLIENVLDFSRIEQGKKQFEFEPTDIRALAQQTVKLMEAYGTERQVALALSIGAGVPHNLQIGADGKALQQALVNLIDNAIKHSLKGQTVTVGLELENADLTTEPEKKRSGSRVLLWVEDNGEGIPPEEHEKIFERFYRLGSELRRQTEGVGIGLSIVKHVVEAHGGSVRVRSAVGHGSRFTIELPESSDAA